MYAGITSLVESVKKIIRPAAVSYTTTSLVIIAVAVIAKILLGRYVKAKGKSVDSGALVASGTDAMSDAILSFAVLVTALIFTFTGFSLEAYVGVVISVFIIKAGYEMISDTVSDILGRRADVETSKKIKEELGKTLWAITDGDTDLRNYRQETEKDCTSQETEEVGTDDFLALFVFVRSRYAISIRGNRTWYIC